MEKRQIKKRPRFNCRYCGKPAVFDVKDEVKGVMLGLMCMECARVLDELGWDYLEFRLRVQEKQFRGYATQTR